MCFQTIFPAWARQRGLTVIEVIVVVGLSGILMTALLRFLVAGHPLSKITYLQISSTEDARLQLRRLARTIREARVADTGAYPLAEAQPQRIVFFANVDGDVLTERVRYELVGTDLMRGIIKPTGDPLTYNTGQEQTSIVAKSIRNVAIPLFTYYSGDYPALQTPLTPTDVTEVKYIQVHLLVDVNPNQDPPPVDVVSQVQMRNLKTNIGETVE